MEQFIVFLKGALLTLVVAYAPFILHKILDVLKAFAERKRTEAKAMENQRVGARLDQFWGIVGTTIEGLITVTDKIQLEKTADGKIIIKNEDAVVAEIKGSVVKQATDSTNDLVKGLGVDIEEAIRAKVRARLGMGA